MPSDGLANHVLDLVRAMGFAVGLAKVDRAGVGEVWRLNARDATGQTWVAEDADFYQAVAAIGRDEIGRSQVSASRASVHRARFPRTRESSAAALGTGCTRPETAQVVAADLA
jgi:hypothetical protein